MALGPLYIYKESIKNRGGYIIEIGWYVTEIEGVGN